jgi:adenosylcobinamide-phosphate synthase
MFAALAFLALLVEGVLGYPQALYAAVGHPVTWIGALIAWCEDAWNHPRLSFVRRRFNGILALLVIVVLTAAVTVGLSLALAWVSGIAGAVLLGVLASMLLAQRSLDEHAIAVAKALETGGIEAGRQAVQQIVGRDTEGLDEAGIARAAIESVSENFSDGVVAPLFWMVLLGLPGAAVYKAVNTADSMLGHRSERYLAFGWAAARLDDLLNLPASRLAAFWIVGAAHILRGPASAAAAWSAVRRDARLHRSPNAGWPEAAMAGALRLKLSGPRVYEGIPVNDPWMGDGREEVSGTDIRAALALYRGACFLQASAVGLLALVILVF